MGFGKCSAWKLWQFSHIFCRPSQPELSARMNEWNLFIWIGRKVFFSCICRARIYVLHVIILEHMRPITTQRESLTRAQNIHISCANIVRIHRINNNVLWPEFPFFFFLFCIFMFACFVEKIESHSGTHSKYKLCLFLYNSVRQAQMRSEILSHILTYMLSCAEFTQISHFQISFNSPS